MIQQKSSKRRHVSPRHPTKENEYESSLSLTTETPIQILQKLSIARAQLKLVRHLLGHPILGSYRIGRPVAKREVKEQTRIREKNKNSNPNPVNDKSILLNVQGLNSAKLVQELAEVMIFFPPLSLFFLGGVERGEQILEY